MHRFCTYILYLCLLSGAQAASVTVTLLATTDMHGNIMPYDYFAAKPVARGLAKEATLIQAARAENPNSLLIDCGDTIQGSPLEAVYQQSIKTGRLPMGMKFEGSPLNVDPMMLVMNKIGYDAMVLGNHEFNFGMANLQKARSEAKFPWLSANTKNTDNTVKPFLPYIVKSVAGVKVAVIGITTPAIPMWEKPDGYRGYRFEPGDKALTETLAILKEKEKPDVVVAAVHAGVERDIQTGQQRAGEMPGENMVYAIANSAPGLDAIIFGHTHRELEGAKIGNVLLVQPKNWAISLARIDFTLEGKPGAWKLASKRSRLIPVTDQTPADPAIVELVKPYHDLTERYLNTRIAESPVEMTGSVARVQDTALLDAVQQVQLYYTQADVSLTALFNPRVRIPKGPVTVREVAALYVYDNELYAIEGTGRMLRDALENAARYFNGCKDAACSGGASINRDFQAFNFDIAQGVDYEIDLTRPEGQRITKLLWKGKPLADDQKLRIAINNYRAAGSGGYTMFRDAKIIWRSSQEIRDLIIEYYSRVKTLPAKADDNWRIVPQSALASLKSAADAEAQRTRTF
jgi:2',3'-cyclic-nucleotide 2'-phosphodiesterase/3'-nucleotidase